MTITKLLVANRGEIAVRVMRAAADLGIEAVAVYSADDARSLHVSLADDAVMLDGRGVAAYLSVPALIEAARSSGCDGLHPGYGLLSENPDLATACAEAGIAFVGPEAGTLRGLGDKAAARELADRLGVPLLPGTLTATTIERARDFRDGLAAGQKMMLKALSGGGGRGIRIVGPDDDLDAAWRACAAEALRAFGNDAIYVEALAPPSRHIEVQILGDGTGAVTDFGERECTLQRRHQKLVEVAPSPGLPPALRDRLIGDAVRMAASLEYRGLGTFEFLVAQDFGGDYWFMEANPRVQVEHTITEETTGTDLVQAQIRVCGGDTLSGLGLSEPVRPQGSAIQIRINAEVLFPDGSVQPSFGRIGRYVIPQGPGVRVDGNGYAGYDLNPGFDTLLAKVIVSARGDGRAAYEQAITRSLRALRETAIGGVETNMAFLHALLSHPDVRADLVHTRFVEDHLADLLAAAPGRTARVPAGGPEDAGPPDAVRAPDGTEPVSAPVAGLVASIEVAEGDLVSAGQTIAVLEAMKMEHAVTAPSPGRIRLLAATSGAGVDKGMPLAFLEPLDDVGAVDKPEEEIDLDHMPSMLVEEMKRRARRMDDARPDAVARRRKTGQRTLRENIGDLCDAGSFVEYGGLAIASQRRRRARDELEAMSPGDGMVTGTATINCATAQHDARAAVIGYDYTVMAGTQGWANHRKLNRMLEVLAGNPLPLVLFAEGGGGRPGETDQMRATGLDTPSFSRLARLSGRKPIIGIVSGRCFAGNAALLGLSDVIIATQDASVGMGGPAMIEGGGLGVFAPEEVGPLSIQVPNGVVDLAVGDEAEAVAAARKYLGFFQGRSRDWTCADQRILRHVVPENRRQTYDVRAAVQVIADEESTLELRPDFGQAVLTVLARVEGRPVGILANNNRFNSGAIDSPAAHKAARFLRLCDTYGLPVVSLCDTPGFMVGPDSERTGAVRNMSRMFLAGANISVPLMTVVLRKGYGLGAMGMAGGSLHESVFTVAWPTAEFGGMGLEGAVRLGHRNELEAISDPDQRDRKFRELVAKYYEDGKAHNAASFVEIDDVIDPAETRTLIAHALSGYPDVLPGHPARYLDSW